MCLPYMPKLVYRPQKCCNCYDTPEEIFIIFNNEYGQSTGQNRCQLQWAIIAEPADQQPWPHLYVAS